MENEFLLQDRVQKIKQIVNKYGEENFYIAFSGGKDSTVLSELVDMAIPKNKIPRVYANTGIELNMIRDFVFNVQKQDERIIIIKPSTPIKQMLEEKGYPFKSKVFSQYVRRYRKNGNTKSVLVYTGKHPEKHWSPKNTCPEKLLYLFEENNDNFPISDKCCHELKKKPMMVYEKESGRHISIIGIMREEGGGRSNTNCLAFDYKNNLKSFHPLSVISKEWEDWFIETYDVKICDIYKSPYNFKRTGCKGCPFAVDLAHELETLEKFFPNERKQCEIIWKPVYEEYRKVKFRLKD